MLVPNKINFKIPKELERFNNSFIDEAIELLYASLINKREEQIIEELRINGYVFDDEFQLKRFFEEMCTIFSFEENNTKILKVGDLILCEWDDTFNFENNGSEIKASLGLIV